MCLFSFQTPASFMTYNPAAEKAAPLAVWPEATRLLCHFHVAQAEWRWLHASSNKISPDERRELMTAFQKDAAEVLKQLHEEEWRFYSLAADNPHYTALEQVLAEMKKVHKEP
ncbi:uncharacterized protein LOC142765243 [Rhipicephalus microplus]|uniref:uncharacterized protein LOC142765243 n=1 Tax=Rhipicephalus microplus TaxID=6941 RepID=UPI003F6C75CD